ncbi:MAG: PQQ-like beta-propeller repeat protein, partial [Holophagales bacterium]|nr:PQQ-like beta-propeller repeat protein [Holophagales bacterium]
MSRSDSHHPEADPHHDADPGNRSGSSAAVGRPRVRWWPALLIVIVASALSAYHWLKEGLDSQAKVMDIFGVVVFAFLALMLWLLLLSRIPWRRRLAAFALVVAAVGLFALLFRIEGVSGNLVPILAFRFAGPPQLESGSGAAEVRETERDFPQFLGPGRDGRITSVSLARDWDARPPRELWRRPVGEAWSGFAVVGDAAVTLEQRVDPESGQLSEVVVRYDKITGEVVWTHAIPAAFETVVGGNGPRTTPTLRRGRVYAFGTLGALRALDLASGALLWQVDVAGESGAEVPSWGYAGSPLLIDLPMAGDAPDPVSEKAVAAVEGEAEGGAAAGGQEDRGRDGAGAGTEARTLVVVSPGGSEGRSLMAFDARDGTLAWAAGDDRAGYSSPSLHVLGGAPQVVVFNGASVAGHDPVDGRQLWTLPWSGDQPNVSQPLALGADRLLVSTGYGIGSGLYRIAREGEAWSAEELWRSTRMKAKFTNLVPHEGKIFGLDDGVLACLDPETGERCWKRGRYGHGQILLVG